MGIAGWSDEQLNAMRQKKVAAWHQACHQVLKLVVVHAQQAVV
jgi:hypothetical protein